MDALQWFADTAITFGVCLLIAGVIVNAVDWLSATLAQREIDEKERGK